MWRWCQTHCPSPATWSGTRLTWTRFCATPGADTPVQRSSSPETLQVTRLKSVLFLCHRKMPEDQYVVRVTVDGVPIPDSRICNGYYKPYYCSLYVSLLLIDLTAFFRFLCELFVWNSQVVWYRTPTISSLSPLSGLPGTSLTASRHFTEAGLKLFI